MNYIDDNSTTTIKAVLLGASNTGKTSIAYRYMKGYFHEYSGPTIGASYMTQTLVKPYGLIKLDLWDTAGQERFESLMPMYYKNAHIALIIYDVTSLETFEKAKTWIAKMNTDMTRSPVYVLVGNKTDLIEQRIVSKDMALNYASMHNVLFFETSVKTSENIQKIFDNAIDEIHRRIMSNPDHYAIDVTNSVHISNKTIGSRECAPGCFGWMP